MEIPFTRLDLDNYCRTVRLRGNKVIFHSMNAERDPLPGLECNHLFKFLTLSKEAGLQPDNAGRYDFLRHTDRPSWYAVYDFDFDDSFFVVFYCNDGFYNIDVRSNCGARNFNQSYTYHMYSTTNYVIYLNELLAQYKNSGDSCTGLKY